MAHEDLSREAREQVPLTGEEFEHGKLGRAANNPGAEMAHVIETTEPLRELAVMPWLNHLSYR
jgi:hypothetical protein